MHKRLIFFTILTLAGLMKGMAQDYADYKTVDSLTYRYYEAKQWDSLIFTGKTAIKNGIDYYYLRLRMGIAFYEGQHFRQASNHFKKALNFNASDDLAFEYLYFSYLWGGMKTEAKALTDKFSSKLREKLKMNRYNLIDELYFEGGPTLGNNQLPQRPPHQKDTLVILRETELTNDVRYFALGVRHSLTKKIELFHSASSIDIGKTQNIDVYGGRVENDYRIFQRQYYASLNFYLGKGFSLKPAYHYINVNYDKLFYSFNDSAKLFLEQMPVKMNDFAASLSLTKNTPLFTYGLNATLARLNNSRVRQGTFSVTAYPMYNLNFYINAAYTWHQNDLQTPDNIAELMLGGRITDRLWLEGMFTYGHLYNYAEKNAYIVYNITDAIHSRKGLSLKFAVNSNIELALYYQNIIKKNTVNEVGINDQLQIQELNKFTNHSITGGIKWTL